MDIDKYFKIKKWHDSSIGQSMVIQQLDEKRPKLSNPNQTQNRRRYVNFENGSHFICSFNLNNPETTVCIAFRNNKKRSHTQLDSRKQVIAFQDRVITINIKEAQHPLK